ncbi:MAG: hypothetical protein U0I22_03925 [Treponema sp.]|nr:hypothetical protein [Treponema sp.]
MFKTESSIEDFNKTSCIDIDSESSMFDFGQPLNFYNEKRAQEYIQEPQNVDYLGDVEKGKEMTFTEADSGNVTPHFEENEGCQ